MVNVLVINSSANETRAALLENSSVAEVCLERSDSSSGMVGNIYKGKVVRILPGIQAAFIDLGFERSAFLYVNDVMSGDGRTMRALAEGWDNGAAAATGVRHGKQAVHGAVGVGEVEGEGTPLAITDLAEGYGSMAHALGLAKPCECGEVSKIGSYEGVSESEDKDDDEEDEDGVLVAGGLAALRFLGEDDDDYEDGDVDGGMEAADESDDRGDEEEDDDEVPYRNYHAHEDNLPPFNGNDYDEDDDDDDGRLSAPKILLHAPSLALQDGNRGQSAGFRRNSTPIEQLLRPGQEILVQVAKAPMGSKGARVTTHITLPGRLVVLLPFSHQIRVSRRISDEKERTRLRKILEEASGGQFGIIARTAAGGRSEKELQGDVAFLRHLHDKVAKRFGEARAPSLLHGDLDLPMRMIRDLHACLGRIVIDSVEMYPRVKDFMTTALPNWTGSLEFHDRPEPIFDHFGIEIELKRALCRKVWLRSGGYLVIDETEALCAIDVNTGRFVGRRKMEDTILQTNLEAVREIVHQLRLRNVGGLIIIDFIDMEHEESRRMVITALEEALKSDRAKTNVSQISSLGLVEMTRKRVQESLRQSMTETCFYCDGRGFIKSRRTVCLEILREVRRAARRLDDQCIVVHAHPRVIDSLFTGEDREALEDVEHKLARQVMLMPARTFHIEEFKVSTISPKQQVADLMGGAVAVTDHIGRDSSVSGGRAE